MAIRIITDTSSDFDYAALSARPVDMVLMTINVGDHSYSDGVDITRSDFYDMLLSDELAPKTSQPSPAEFLPFFEKARDDGDDVIAILISGVLSGTVQAAQTAKALSGYDRIFIVDSHCATWAIQLMVTDAEKLAAQGISAEEIVAHLESLKKRVRIYLGIDTLKYLYRGGRLSRVEAGIGTLTGIRPLLYLKNGKLKVAAKCIGAKKAQKKLAEIISGFRIDPAYEPCFIYSYDDDNCNALMDLLPGVTNRKIEIGATLATHAGPGVYGLVFIEAE